MKQRCVMRAALHYHVLCCSWLPARHFKRHTRLVQLVGGDGWADEVQAPLYANGWNATQPLYVLHSAQTAFKTVPIQPPCKHV